ncbi:MAG: phytanoyl-CoA dioxygenase family protein [Saprospirales bacterium]|nr:phytanoyl-CoA dioxygenase family protein [Saprospirales bacterium]
MSNNAIALPDLSAAHHIAARQRAEYHRNGHILLRGILHAADANIYRDAIVQAVQRYNTETRQMEDRDTYGRAFLQIMNLWEVDAQVRQFTLARRFAQIAADLMGVERVRLYHDQALFKEPGGGHTPWHQDQYYWPIDTANTITMWMPLVDISEEMGMLTFASGSQELGFLGNLAISDDSEAVLSRLVAEKGYPVTRATHMQAGDATFHAGWTLHAAPGNLSDRMREVMTVIYVADGARVIEPKNEHQEADRQRWLSAWPVGALIDSALNPLLNG